MEESTDCNKNLAALQEIMMLADMAVTEGGDLPRTFEVFVLKKIHAITKEVLPKHTHFCYEATKLHRERHQEECLLREILPDGQTVLETGPHPTG